ncbi:hypothetical protein [Adhaeribacter rhizoryzae]|uniref:Translation initiation factor IF-2 n=1 Tax=Adhaeribacter rhizoryzae TaxID=2607907 RepID=A0A5M6DTL6_9BACT|nr:hypothetical protein [Adhaeribacter rhizoryzae]KAA5549552.1 hypothetical protein F0145_02920 [Adhaeribacter rhizoryzae]
MKILIAAVAFIFIAAAANARHLAFLNIALTPVTKTTHEGSEENLHAPDAQLNESATVNTAAGNRKGLLRSLKLKKDQQKPTETNTPQQDQNPAQNPANPETDVRTAQPPQEVKAIPKARRVEKPAKVESSAKRPSVGSAKRGNAGSARPNAATAKPDRPNNPGQVNRAPRASRPTGGGRPDHAGRPNKGKGKD